MNTAMVKLALLVWFLPASTSSFASECNEYVMFDDFIGLDFIFKGTVVDYYQNDIQTVYQIKPIKILKDDDEQIKKIPNKVTAAGTDINCRCCPKVTKGDLVIIALDTNGITTIKQKTTLYKKAEAFFKIAVPKNKNEQYLNDVKALLAARQYKKAIEKAESFSVLDADETTRQCYIAEAFYYLGDLQKAYQHMKLSIAIYEDDESFCTSGKYESIINQIGVTGEHYPAK